MKLLHANGTFVFACSFADKEVPKQAGFRWNPENKYWYTTDASVAMRLKQYADASATEAINKGQRDAMVNVEASRASTSAINIPTPPGLEFYPFQKAGIEFLVANITANHGVLLSDQMGLGKSPMSIGYINAVGHDVIRRILIVCPASLKLNWKREFERWITDNGQVYNVSIVDSDKPWPERADVCIINWDILGKAHSIISPNGKKITCRNRSCPECHGTGVVLRFPQLNGPWDLIIGDEIHAIKSYKSCRCRAFTRLSSPRKIGLSGTPILNRPIELQTTLAWLDKSMWGNRWSYAKRYCALTTNRFGTDMSGASNLDELNYKLRSSGTMIRRLKADVLKELPPKVHQVIELPVNGSADLVENEWTAYRKVESVLSGLRVAMQLAKTAETDSEYHAAIEALKKGEAAAFKDMSLARKAVAMAKLPYVCTHINEIMEDDEDKKIVCFGHHLEFISSLCKMVQWLNPVEYVGDTPLVKRQEYVDRFQKDPACRLFVGGILPAGVGITLTASSHVVLAEFDWRPAMVEQAIDRTHRIGQTESVLAQYMVLAGSLDSYMAKTIIKKQAIISAALDAESKPPEDAEVSVSAEENASPIAAVTRKEIIEKSVVLTPEDTQVVLAALRCITALDLDFAATKNAVGWSKNDVEIGHSLSKRDYLTPRQSVIGLKLANKYRKQLPEDIHMGIERIRERLKEKED